MQQKIKDVSQAIVPYYKNHALQEVISQIKSQPQKECESSIQSLSGEQCGNYTSKISHSSKKRIIENLSPSYIVKLLKNGETNSSTKSSFETFLTDTYFWNKKLNYEEISKQNEKLLELFESANEKLQNLEPLQDNEKKWGEFFKKHIKDISPDNYENDFKNNLKCIIFLQQLLKEFKPVTIKDRFGVDKPVIKNARFYLFDENLANKVFETNSKKGFLANYKNSLYDKLFKDCKKIELDNGAIFEIERLDNKDAQYLENLNEHDELQVSRLRYLACEAWCTTNKKEAAHYLSQENSYVFVPKVGNRKMRIQGNIKNNIFQISHITPLENHSRLLKEDFLNLDKFVKKLQENNIDTIGYMPPNENCKNDKEVLEILQKISFAHLVEKFKTKHSTQQNILTLLPNVSIQNNELSVNNENKEANNILSASKIYKFCLENNLLDKMKIEKIVTDEKTVDCLDLQDMDELILKDLAKTDGSIALSNLNKVHLPVFQKAYNIFIRDCNEVNLEQLSEIENAFYIDYAKKVNLDKLQTISLLSISTNNSGIQINAPSLNNVERLELYIDDLTPNGIDPQILAFLNEFPQISGMENDSNAELLKISIDDVVNYFTNNRKKLQELLKLIPLVSKTLVINERIIKGDELESLKTKLSSIDLLQV